MSEDVGGCRLALPDRWGGWYTGGMPVGESVRVRGLPTGEVTFLFTDIESSTELWERDAGAMASAVADHDELLRGAVDENGGVVFKGLGDGICAVFDTASHGAAAALEAQHRLETQVWPTDGPLRVRMALHTGPGGAAGRGLLRCGVESGGAVGGDGSWRSGGVVPGVGGSG